METRERFFILKTVSLFNMNIKMNLLIFLMVLSSAAAAPAGAQSSTAAEPAAIKKDRTTLYVDLVDQTVYSEFTNYLRLDRLYRKLFNKKLHAQDINVYDEIPDSPLFQHRHARERLSLEELEKGYFENDGPSPEGPVTVIKGKTEGVHPGFFVKDSRGDFYLLKFDPEQNLELNSSAEVISSRFYHAFGYNVPQYTIFTFDSSRLAPAENATFVDPSGFTKKLTQDDLDSFSVYLPRTENGDLRASASKILKGENKGDFRFQGLRKDDPSDKIKHERLRAIRALAVFGAFLNNNDVRRQNTLDMLVTENGKSFLKHYLIDFNSTLGGTGGGAKPPMFTHEHFVDHMEVIKNIFSFGFRKSTWQKRWEEAGKKENDSFAQGYLDNNRFSPEEFKTQLPYYAFKDLTRADGYWAAKILKSFSDEDIQAIIKAAKYSDPEDAAFILRILSERREAIVRYWMSQASPLENFNLENGKLTFDDLEIHYGYVPSSVYRLAVFSGDGKKGKRLGILESQKQEFNLSADWLEASLTLLIQAYRPNEESFRPHVLVKIKGKKIAEVLHQD